MKKSLLYRVVLAASLIGVTATYANNSSEVAITSFGKFVYAIEKLISDFFNASNKTAYNTYVIEFEKNFQDIKRSAESVTRGVCDELTQEIYDVVEYSLQQFNVAYNIIKKYNGRSSTEATAFGVEIKRDFNPEKIFAELIVKLKALKCKAKAAHESAVEKKIDTIITLIEKKRKEWNAKADWVLFAGLKVRMDSK